MKLNIVTITKDDIDGLKRTIESTERLRKMSFVRQIVIDSSSGEISSDIKDFLNYKKNIEYYWQKPEGIASAFNYGLSKAKNKWIWFLNGGDEMDRDVNVDWLQKYLEKAESDILIFDIKIDGKIVRKPSLINMWPLVYNWIPHPSTIINKDMLDKIGGFNLKYKLAMDGELFFRLLNMGATVDNISIILADFFSGGTSSNNILMGKEVKRIIWNNKTILVKKYFGIFTRVVHAWVHFSKLENRQI